MDQKTMNQEQEIIWHGPGWYAPRQEGQHDTVRVVWQSVDVFELRPEQDNRELADKLAKHKSLGTPQWLVSPDEI